MFSGRVWHVFGTCWLWGDIYGPCLELFGCVQDRWHVWSLQSAWSILMLRIRVQKKAVTQCLYVDNSSIWHCQRKNYESCWADPTILRQCLERNATTQRQNGHGLSWILGIWEEIKSDGQNRRNKRKQSETVGNKRKQTETDGNSRKQTGNSRKQSEPSSGDREQSITCQASPKCKKRRKCHKRTAITQSPKRIQTKVKLKVKQLETVGGSWGQQSFATFWLVI